MRDFLHHLFVPRESNNHRAGLLHHKSILFLLILLLVVEVFFIATEKKYSDVLGITANISAEELLSITNQKRAEKGLAPLSLDNQLSNSAKEKGNDMFAKNYWAHVGPDGGTPWGFIRTAGYEYIYAGENLARGFTTSQEVVDAWMASPGHRDNMLSPNYKDVGFAILNGTLTGDETVLVVEQFGSRSGAQVASEVTSTNEISVTPVATISPVIVAQNIPLIPTTSLSPTIPALTPSPTPIQVITPEAPQSLVASFQSNPLIDSSSAKKNIVMIVLSLIVMTLVADLLIIERKKIVRLFAHNLDHIIFLVVLLSAVIIISKEAIL